LNQRARKTCDWFACLVSPNKQRLSLNTAQ